MTGEDFDGLYGARLMVLANRVPQFTDNSQGLARRAEGLVFTRNFDDDTKDVKLLDKLLPELPGIFLWALEGCQRLHATLKFTPSKSSTELHRKIVRAGGRCRVVPWRVLRARARCLGVVRRPACSVWRLERP